MCGATKAACIICVSLKLACLACLASVHHLPPRLHDQGSVVQLNKKSAFKMHGATSQTLVLLHVALWARLALITWGAETTQPGRVQRKHGMPAKGSKADRITSSR